MSTTLDQWLKFDGTAQDQGTTYRLTSSDGSGVIEMDKTDVQLSGNNIEVRLGATGKMVKAPTGDPPANYQAQVNSWGNCPSGIHQCTGLILWCC